MNLRLYTPAFQTFYQLFVGMFLLGSISLQAQLQTGLYRLSNGSNTSQSPPGYGLRLDELIDVSRNDDIFTWDFDHQDSEMFLNYNGTEVHIYGKAFGGLDIGTEYDPNLSGIYEIDFIYNRSLKLYGNKLYVKGKNGYNKGSITDVKSGQSWNLWDYKGWKHHSFFFDGTKGIGRLSHTDKHRYFSSSDWIFHAEEYTPVPEPSTYFMLGSCLTVAAYLKKKKQLKIRGE